MLCLTPSPIELVRSTAHLSPALGDRRGTPFEQAQAQDMNGTRVPGDVWPPSRSPHPSFRRSSNLSKLTIHSRDGDRQGPSCRDQWLRGVEYLEQQRIDVAKPEFTWPSGRHSEWQKVVYHLSGVQAIGRKPSGRRVLFIHVGKAGGSSTAKFLDAARIPCDQVHCNAVLPEVALAPSFTQTLVVVRDPITRLSSAFDYSLRGTAQDPEQFRRLGECFALPTLEALVELYTRESEGECWSLARDLLVLHEKPAGHMQFNACWYLGGIVDKLKNVFVAQQETLDQDLEAFRAYFDNGTAIEQGPSVGCTKCAPTSHANISETSLRALSVILRTEYDAVNAVMALSQNKRGVSYTPPF